MTTITWPTVTVEIAFDSILVAKSVSVQGANWSNITAYLLQWGYKRGRNRQLGRAEAGTAYLILDNTTGIFDPENASSPYYNGHVSESSGTGMGPRRHVRIRATWSGTTYNLFYGCITRWETQELRPGQTPTAKVEVTDILGWLGRGVNNLASVSTSMGTSGYQLDTILQDTQIGFSSDMLLLDEGTSILPAISGSTFNLVQMITDIADSEAGAILFIDGAGRFVYHEGIRRTTAERSIVLQAIFDNDATAIADGAVPFTRARYKRDMAEYANSVTISAPDIGTRTADDNTAILRYGPWPMSKSTRLGSGPEMTYLAERLRNDYNRFEGSYDEVAIEAGGNNAVAWRMALGLTISDQVRIMERLYPGRIRRLQAFVEGMSVAVDNATWSWKVTYNLSGARPGRYWHIRGKGVAFPTAPTVHEIYYRTDIDLFCYYDGTRWLTVNEYETSPIVGPANQPFSAGQSIGYWPKHSTYNRYITDLNVTFNVQTTNNGSNYWTIRLVRLDTGAALTSDISTAAASAGAWVSSGLGLTLLTGAYPVGLNIVKNGAPGNIYVAATISYRLEIP